MTSVTSGDNEADLAPQLRESSYAQDDEITNTNSSFTDKTKM